MQRHSLKTSANDVTKPSSSGSHMKANIKYSKTFRSLDREFLNSFISFYNDLKFVHGTCTVAWNIDEQKKKPEPSTMPNLNQRKEVQQWKLTDNMAYVMAEESNLTVIDIDDVQKCKKLTRLCIEHCKYHVKTKKGFHFYFKRCNEFPKSKLESAGLGFDMPTLLYAPPGYYETDKERIEYQLVRGTCYGFDEGIFGASYKDLTDNDEVAVVTMPKVIIDEIKSLLASKNKDKKPVTQVQTIPVQTVPVQSTTVSNDQFQKYKEFLVLIQDRNQEYEDWRNVGFALHQISDSDKMYQVFAEWSQVNYPNFDEAYTQKFWDKCKDDRGNMITFGTLVHWAKESNSEGYKEWNNKWGFGKLKHLVNNFDHSEAAKYFKHLKPNNYIYKDNQGWWMLMVGENNGRWKFSKEATGFINTLCGTIKTDLNKLRYHYSGKINVLNTQLARTSNKNEQIELSNKVNYCNSQISVIKKCCTLIGNVNFQKSVIVYLQGLYLNDKVQFDNVWYYLGFDDGLFDLKTGEFRAYKPEDYMTMSVGYNYSDVIAADTTTMLNLINQIHPDEESRQCWLSIVSTALEGRTLERFTIFNGKGRNGKGLLNEILLLALGKGQSDGYAATLNPAVLCSPIIKDGPNPEVAKLDKMRLVVTSEFPKGSMLNNAVVKQLTGGCHIEARFCHSNNTAVNLACTIIAECNDRPPFRDKLGTAELERLIDLYFPCDFTARNEDEINPENNKYIPNIEYKTLEFQNQQKLAMMKILLDAYLNFKGKVSIPNSVIERNLRYAIFSHPVFNWFDENYTLVEKPEPLDFVTIATVFEEVRATDIYTNLSVTDKRMFTKSKINELFKTSVLYSKYFADRYQPRTKSGKLNVRNVLKGFVKVNEDGNLIRPYNEDIIDPTLQSK